jgi:hypothetical protein
VRPVLSHRCVGKSLCSVRNTKGLVLPRQESKLLRYRNLHSEEEVCRTFPLYNKTIHIRNDKGVTRKEKSGALSCVTTLFTISFDRNARFS